MHTPVQLNTRGSQACWRGASLGHTYLSVLRGWRCLQCIALLLGGRKGIRPVKKLECWGAGMVICQERDADLHMAQLMPLPLTASCFSKIQIGFTFLVPAHLGSPGKRAVKRVCVLRMEAESRCSARPLR